MNVMYGGAKERVILYGLDCPEIGQPFGDQARKFTDDHCFKKTLRLDEKGKDKRGRTIAVVYLADGTNLNDELVRQGLAWWSDKYAPADQKLKDLQAQAKAAHRGLWQQPNPVPPWIWRNGQKEVKATLKQN